MDDKNNISEKEIEILYDHYKDSNRIIESAIVRRNRYFIFGFLLVLVTLLITVEPKISLNVIEDLGKEKLKVTQSFSFHLVNTFFLYLSIWFWVRYYQTVILIENQYIYVHELEMLLKEKVDIDITREGESYKKNYSILGRRIKQFYTILIPSSILILSNIKLYLEWNAPPTVFPMHSRVLDSFGLVILIYITLLYLTWIHFKDFRKISKEKDTS